MKTGDSLSRVSYNVISPDNSRVLFFVVFCRLAVIFLILTVWKSFFVAFRHSVPFSLTETDDLTIESPLTPKERQDDEKTRKIRCQQSRNKKTIDNEKTCRRTDSFTTAAKCREYICNLFYRSNGTVSARKIRHLRE